MRRAPEALPVVHLELKDERGEGVEAAEAAQPGHGRPPPRLERESGEALLERGLAGGEAVDGGERVQVGELAGGVLEALGGEPAAVGLRPVEPPW